VATVAEPLPGTSSDSSLPALPTYLHLMASAQQLCREPELSRLVPRRHADKPTDPRAEHEAIAYDWLARGGKRARPFMTLAAFHALRPDDGLPDPVRRAAVAIEAFHKASLVHDDIQDEDEYRYGATTLHHRHGVATAINVGDYLIGLGYRLVSADRTEVGGDCAADMTAYLAEAHLQLSEGQGAELLWRNARRDFTVGDALELYALKTAPAFAAALYLGLRLAGPAEKYESAVKEFCRDLGIAFQVRNDLDDLLGDRDNKLLAGQDLLAGRPTVLLALALEALDPAEREPMLAELRTCRPAHPGSRADTLTRLRGLFSRARVLDRASALIDSHGRRAVSIAESATPARLSAFLNFLVRTVLDRPPATGHS
jgi:geranylgeranyl pyrophosphate synthase